MKILVSVLHDELGTLELQAERTARSPEAPIGLVLPGCQHWLSVADATALRGLLLQAIEWARPKRVDR